EIGGRSHLRGERCVRGTDGQRIDSSSGHGVEDRCGAVRAEAEIWRSDAVRVQLGVLYEQSGACTGQHDTMVAVDDELAVRVTFDVRVDRCEAVGLAWGVTGGQYESFGVYRQRFVGVAVPEHDADLLADAVTADRLDVRHQGDACRGDAVREGPYVQFLAD